MRMSTLLLPSCHASTGPCSLVVQPMRMLNACAHAQAAATGDDSRAAAPGRARPGSEPAGPPIPRHHIPLRGLRHRLLHGRCAGVRRATPCAERSEPLAGRCCSSRIGQAIRAVCARVVEYSREGPICCRDQIGSHAATLRHIEMGLVALAVKG